MAEHILHKQGMILAALAPGAGSRAGGYALDLSRVVQGRQGQVEVKLTLPEQQRAIFRQAEEYGVSVQHDTTLGVYFVSGNAEDIAKFLKSVTLLSDAQIVSRIVMDIAVTPQGGEPAAYTLAVGRDKVSGEPSASLTHPATGGGVSQVVLEHQAITEEGIALSLPGRDSVPLPSLMGGLGKASVAPRDIADHLLRVTLPPGGKEGGSPVPDSTGTPPAATPAPVTPEADAPPRATFTHTSSAGKAAPVLNDLAHVLTAVNEDVANGANTGTLVSDMLQASSLELAGTGQAGITVIGVDNANGTWEYRLPAGAWTPIAATGDTTALLLADDALIRFVPDADYNGTADITFRGWDRTDGSNSGDTKDISGELGNTGNAFSLDADTAQITVNAVNDVPVLLAAISDTPAEIGNPFSLDVSGNFDDIDTGDTLVFTALLSSGAALPAWLTLNSATGVFSGTPAGGDAGQLEINLTAADGNGGSVIARVYVDIGAFTQQGTAGADTFTGGAGAHVIHGGNGVDSLTGGASSDWIFGGSGNDTLDGSGGDDVLYGGSGNDNVFGNFGNDTLIGGDGNDTLDGYSNHDYLEGGAGDDSLIGANNNDTLIGGEGNDYLNGGDQFDSLDGGEGNDTIIGGRDADTLNGGGGNDLFLVDSTAGLDTFDGGAGVDSIQGSAGNDLIGSITSIEFIDGGAGNDSIHATAADDIWDLYN